jgi:hypothetical protein
MNRVVCDHKHPDGAGGYSPSAIGTRGRTGGPFHRPISGLIRHVRAVPLARDQIALNPLALIPVFAISVIALSCCSLAVQRHRGTPASRRPAARHRQSPITFLVTSLCGQAIILPYA